MALPASFPISASEINVELGRAPTATFNMLGAEERELAEVPVGAVSMSDFLGKERFGAEFLASYSDLYTDPITFSTIDIGDAHAERRVFVTVHFFGKSGGVNTLDAATIGGIAATRHAQDGNRNSGTNDTYQTAIISAVVPTGTTADIVLNWSGASSGTVLIGVYRTKSLQGGIIDTFANHCAFTCSLINGTITVPAEGVLFVAATGMAGASDNVTITNPSETKDYDGANYAGIMLRDQPSAASRAIQATIAGPSANVNIVAVSWTGL